MLVWGNGHPSFADQMSRYLILFWHRPRLASLPNGVCFSEMNVVELALDVDLAV
jgi:hypothetical protein